MELGAPSRLHRCLAQALVPSGRVARSPGSGPWLTRPGAQIIQSVPMSSIHQMQMSNNLTFFHDVLGGCERLLRAPIPVSYTR